MLTNKDAQVILLMCANFGGSANQEIESFSTREWSNLARKIYAHELSPGELLEFNSEDLSRAIDLTESESRRINLLLQRSGSLAIELEKWASLGIQVVTRADQDYPRKYRERLKENAPPIIFYSGEHALLNQPGIAVVGSRNLDQSGIACAEFIGNACGISGQVLFTGGAKGVDQIGMKSALDARGTSVGILADSLEKAIRLPEYRAAISRGDLCLATTYSPSVPFSVGRAMGRNKLIYTLAEHAIVVASGAETGGTWAGATEALKAKWLPVFVLNYPDMPEGNRKLLNLGATEFPFPFKEEPITLMNWLNDHSRPLDSAPSQPSLF